MDEYEILRHVRNATEMGVIGIDSVADRTVDTGLSNALEQQREEYSELYAQAGDMLNRRGEAAKPVGQMVKACARMKGRYTCSTDARIAAMMVHGNTRGMIKSCQKLNQASGLSTGAEAIAKKLLATETNNIEQMKQFL